MYGIICSDSEVSSTWKTNLIYSLMKDSDHKKCILIWINIMHRNVSVFQPHQGSQHSSSNTAHLLYEVMHLNISLQCCYICVLNFVKLSVPVYLYNAFANLISSPFSHRQILGSSIGGMYVLEMKSIKEK